jgi:hypothetical protein
MKFELYKNICSQCRHEFATLNLPTNIVSKVYAATEANEVILLIPDQTREWTEICRLVQITLLELDVDQRLEEIILESVVNHAFDYSEEGLRYYLWGHIPCPECNSFTRTFTGPYPKPVHVDISTHVAQFHTWRHMPNVEKERVTREIAELHRQHEEVE